MAAKYVSLHTIVLILVHNLAGELYFIIFLLNSCNVALSGPGLLSDS